MKVADIIHNADKAFQQFELDEAEKLYQLSIKKGIKNQQQRLYVYKSLCSVYA